MSIKARIRIFQLVVALAALIMAVTALLAIRSNVRDLVRVQGAREQFAAMTRLAIDANRYSEQIAEFILLGEAERPDLEGARAQMSLTFVHLREITAREVEALEDGHAKDEERQELQRIDSLQSLYREVDRGAERVLLLAGEGRREEAIALFRSEIENRLDADFEKLIGEGIADEGAEVVKVDAEAEQLTPTFRDQHSSASRQGPLEQSYNLCEFYLDALGGEISCRAE